MYFQDNKASGLKREISPQESSRAEAFRLWMSSPMPMVTLVKMLDVSRLVKVGKKSGMKFTTLMCLCIGKAASQIEEFYTLPENGKLFQYDRLAVNVIVENSKGGINSCDIPFTDDLQQFHRPRRQKILRSFGCKRCLQI